MQLRLVTSLIIFLGKTTTISMLTGLVPASGGDAFVRGYSIRDQMNQVRQKLGVCPQHDVIWPDLTVYDHLYLYAGLKGVAYKDIKRTVDELVDTVLGSRYLPIGQACKDVFS